MKLRHFPLAGSGTLAAASFILAFAPALRAPAQTAAVNPFTYLGRLMDSSHAAFDADRVATISAYDAGGTLLAKSETFFLPDSRRNYRLRIPLADGDAKGFSKTGNVLSIAVEDDAGRVWSGVVVDAGATNGLSTVGEPGGVYEVDIVLGEDKDGDGVDDALLERLKRQWEIYGDPSETEFDPTADHDGDGVSTIDEALAGTNPFDKDDALRIKTFVLDAETLRGATNALTSLSFPVVLGRAYAVQTADAPTGTWSNVSFFLAPGDAAPVNVLAVSSKATAAVGEPVTVYLLPASDRDAAFFRVKVEGDAKPED
ncbi:MAG: hypothetical protein II839_03240 [Kiritimatiellae bacterium]|nr:hypothetical protein [Kiritimatiellia bacterium]